ncbi:hypothetical protein HanXRQr2_Chr16g0765751 [Helianthus annuus]|uniref:Uncharacterized protein n=1 Tax=Helianthus annuus TaxID=4232 RepID=A0A9K3DUZ9_HELAN|nr:hypothetical protein HanXRQr2_Chr16g0765751 [Helianthus annuus]
MSYFDFILHLYTNPKTLHVPSQEGLKRFSFLSQLSMRLELP